MHDGHSSLLTRDAARGKKKGRKGMWSAYYPRSSHARLPLDRTGRSFTLHASNVHRRADDDDDDGAETRPTACASTIIRGAYNGRFQQINLCTIVLMCRFPESSR